MNSVSWLIYIADLVKNISEAATIAFVMMIVWGVMLNIRSAAHNDTKSRDEPPMAYSGKPFIIAIFIAAVSVPIPSKSTIYMIAASELGEKAINTELAGDVLEIVKKEIKKMKDAK